MEKRANPPGESDIFLNNFGADIKNNATLYGGLTLGATGLAGLLSAVRPRKPGESKGQRTRRTLHNMLRAGLGTAGGIAAYSAAKNISGLGDIDPSQPMIRTSDGRMENAPPEVRPPLAVGKDVAGGALALGAAGLASGAGARSLWDMSENQVRRLRNASNPAKALRTATNTADSKGLITAFLDDKGHPRISPKNLEKYLISATSLDPTKRIDVQRHQLNNLFGTHAGGADEIGRRVRQNILAELRKRVYGFKKKNPGQRVTYADLPESIRARAVAKGIQKAVGSGDTTGQSVLRRVFGTTGRGKFGVGNPGGFFHKTTGAPKVRGGVVGAASLLGPLIMYLRGRGSTPPPATTPTQ